MIEFLKEIDKLTGENSSKPSILWIERLIFIFLFLMTLFLPHSIAATQTAWLAGMVLWIVRFFLSPRPQFRKTNLEIALWSFFIWSVVSAIFSYAPDISLDKLRGVLLFLIAYFVLNNVKTLKSAKFLVAGLIASSMIAVIWTPIERFFGRGVEVHGVRYESLLDKAQIIDGDTILKAGKKKISTPEELLQEIEQNETTKVEFYRPDFNLVVEVKRADLLDSGDTLGKLGIGSWKKSRNWRSAGFYGHYTTFAEVLQLIASLTFGIFIGLFSLKSTNKNLNRRLLMALIFCLAGMSLALFLTFTRASQLAFLISAFSIVLVYGNRKFLLGVVTAITVFLLIGGVYLQQTRKVGFFDSQDNSIIWRQTVYREGINLASENLRHILIGVGMDSIKRYAEEWKLFDEGKLPKGHFHSTPLQIIVERGFPALIFWIWFMFSYLQTLFRNRNLVNRGIILGCFGGAIGFLVSGLVHYNLGDAEVAMVFFWLMGLSLAIINHESKAANSSMTI